MCPIFDINTECKNQQLPPIAVQILDTAISVFFDTLGYRGSDAVEFISIQSEPQYLNGLIAVEYKAVVRVKPYIVHKKRPKFYCSDELYNHIVNANSFKNEAGFFTSFMGVENDLQELERQFDSLVFKMPIGWVNFNAELPRMTICVNFQDENIEQFGRYLKLFLQHPTYDLTRT